MRFDRGIILSVAGHGAVLAWALVSFARPVEHKPFEMVPVDVVSAEELSKITAGVEKAQKKEAPKPVVEKIAEAKPVEDINAKVTEKKEVNASTNETTPEPKPKQPDPKPAAAPPEPQKETKAPEKKEPDQKTDPIAEALKKEETKKPEKKVERKPQPEKKPEPQQPKFDPRRVAALLDKRDPHRLAAAGDALNSTASLGTARGMAQQLSLSELDALRARIQQCWSMPPGYDASTVVVDVRLRLRPDGSLAAAPTLDTAATTPAARVVAETALRAITRCAPYNFLPAAKYETWKDITVGFDAGWAARM